MAFDSDIVKACKSVVEEYRMGRSAKATALHDLLNILDTARAGDPEHALTTAQKNHACDEFFAQLEDIDWTWTAAITNSAILVCNNAREQIHPINQ